MADKERLLHRIRTEEDFVNSPRHGNSLKRVADDNPDGIEDHQAAKMLCCTEKEVKEMYGSAVEMIRSKIASKWEDAP